MASDDDILTQDEVSALLEGVDNGDVDTEGGTRASGSVRVFDFAAQERISRGRMPTLDMINQRCARGLRAALHTDLHRDLEVKAGSVELSKYNEYMQSIPVPSSLNLIKMQPLRGTALIVFRPELIAAVVDKFFGGAGRAFSRTADRELTQTELRIVDRLMKATVAELESAWKTVAAVVLEPAGTETNPNFVTIAAPTEMVVLCRFTVDFDGLGGELHVVIPMTMIEPLREQLDSGLKSDRQDQDAGWAVAIRSELEEAPVSVSSVLTEMSMPLGELLKLKPGDVIPVELPANISLLVEGVPAFRGTFGNSRGFNAVQITGRASKRGKKR